MGWVASWRWPAGWPRKGIPRQAARRCHGICCPIAWQATLPRCLSRSHLKPQTPNPRPAARVGGNNRSQTVALKPHKKAAEAAFLWTTRESRGGCAARTGQVLGGNTVSYAGTAEPSDYIRAQRRLKASRKSGLIACRAGRQYYGFIIDRGSEISHRHSHTATTCIASVGCGGCHRLHVLGAGDIRYFTAPAIVSDDRVGGCGLDHFGDGGATR